MAMTREQVLAASQRRKVEEVSIAREGWGAARLRELSTAEMFAFRKEVVDKPDEEAGLHLLAKCWVDDADTPLFEGEPGVEALGAIPVEVLNQLTQAVLRVNALTEKAVEAAEKN